MDRKDDHSGHWLWAAIMVALLVASLGYQWMRSRGAAREAARIEAGEVAEPESVEAIVGNPENRMDRPGAFEHTRMRYLQFEAKAGEIVLASRSLIEGTVKFQRSLRGKSGLYYRALADDGGSLADGVIPDPFAIHYRLEGEGEAVGGVLPLADTAFAIRLPHHEAMTTVELFRIRSGEIGERLGEFRLDEQR